MTNAIRTGTFKVNGTIVRELRPATPTIGPLYEIDVPAQTATNRDGSSCELTGRVVLGVVIRRLVDEGVTLVEGDGVAVLVEPDAPHRHSRIIHRRSVTWGRR